MRLPQFFRFARLTSIDEDLSAQALEMAREELRMNEVLLQHGDISQLEVMRARRQVVEIEGQRNATRNEYLERARLEATQLAEELAANGYKLDDRRSVLEHTVLTAPIAGVIKYLRITTVGGVLRPGDELLQISPTEGEMVFEVKINPVDIGQLRTGLPVSIKLDAFDYSVYGALEGRLVYLSPDTLAEQGADGQTLVFYRARVQLDAERARSRPVARPGISA